MERQTLNGYWQVRQAGKQKWLPASVPGGVHTDLMAAGVIPDPFYGTEERQAQWVAEKNWEYRRFFYPSPAVFRQEKIWLVCDGLDTLAEVRLNGTVLGQAYNAYRTWRWEIKDALLEGENRLEILFRSPVSYVRRRRRARRLAEMNMGIAGGAYLRKPPSHFGWDWGPRLPIMGIWQEIRLEGRGRGQLVSARFDQQHAPGTVTLTARVQSEIWEPEDGHQDGYYTVRVRITGPEHEVWQLDAPARTQTAMTFTIPNPQLWWPNGMGGQPLYTAEVELRGGEDNLLDRRVMTVGLRTLALRQEEDTRGREFTFVVNGVSLFCKGSNWIPADSFPARVNPEKVEALIRAAAETNQNMLRVWGGGYYESDLFYDLCDRYGILVWQDFQFSCGMYPLDDPTYVENALAEARENTRRLRHHPSLALWCGNNEIEWLGGRLGWFLLPSAREPYERFFFHDLPAMLAEEDPSSPYWPGSPSSNNPFHDPNGESSGDAHLWEVFGEFRLPRHYREHHPRFASEFGFQAYPHPATIDQYCPAGQREPDSDAINCHQRAAGGNARLAWYLSKRFRLPKTLDGLAYLSQVMQAETIREAVEHWRRHSDRTSGALYWQLNDCWPVTSWSSIDYYGRWKALHYAARRFYAPVLLSVAEERPHRARSASVWISSDCRDPWQGRLHWTLETLDGEVLEGGDQPVLAAPMASECLLKLDFSHRAGVDWRRVVLVCELLQGQNREALRITPFVDEREMPVLDAGLRGEVRVAGGRIIAQVSAKRAARFVELSLESADVVFSDNYFDLPAGRSATIECPLPEGWTEEQARACLRLRSLDGLSCDSPALSRWKGDLALVRSFGQIFWQTVALPALNW